MTHTNFMILFRRLFLLLAFALILSFAATAQNTNSTAAPAPKPQVRKPVPLPAELVSFFSGDWKGTGEFASGKKIEADASFKVELGNQWLFYRHTDRAPNNYQVFGTWGFDRESGKFVMLASDNSGGARLFISEGWKDGKIVFLKDALLAPITFYERFTFEKQSGDVFKMTYESSRDGQQWHLGDYLIFKKTR